MNRENLVYAGVGLLLGGFLSLGLVIYLDVLSLQIFCMFGVAVLVLGFLKTYGENNSHKKALYNKEETKKPEKKTIRNKIRVWNK